LVVVLALAQLALLGLLPENKHRRPLLPVGQLAELVHQGQLGRLEPDTDHQQSDAPAPGSVPELVRRLERTEAAEPDCHNSPRQLE